MKIKKKIIIGAVIAICAVAGLTIWAVETTTSRSAEKSSTEVSASKDKMDHSMSAQSSHKKSSQTKGSSPDKSKSNVESKSRTKIQGQSSATVEAASQLRKDAKDRSNDSSSKVQTFTGYITSEDDFAAGLKEDTANMVHMRLMALSGLGITFQQNGKWVFYYFDGTFSTDNKKSGDGKWSFNGTGSQLKAWYLVEQSVKSGRGKSPVLVTVAGILDGSTETNSGPDADGRKFPVIKVESMK